MRQQYIHVFIEGQKEEQASKPASRVPATAPQNTAKNIGVQQQEGLTRCRRG